MHVVPERPGLARRSTSRRWTTLVLTGCALSSLPLGAQQQDTASRGPVQRAAAIFVRIDSAIHSAVGRADSTLPAFTPSCQAVRGAVLGVAAYEGIAIGSLTELTVRSWNGPRALVFGSELLGGAAAVLWAMNEPLPRPLPFCPSGMRTVSGRAPNAVIGCRASQVAAGMLGLHSGSVAAVTLVPVVTVVEFLRGRSSADRRRDRRLILVGLPLGGAAVGAFEAQRRSPCSASHASI